MLDFMKFSGDIIMIVLALCSFCLSLYLLVKVLRGQELKDRKYIYELKSELFSITHLRMNLGLIVSKSFIYGHKNTGKSPCDLKELHIDDIYLTSSSNIIVSKEACE